METALSLMVDDMYNFGKASALLMYIRQTFSVAASLRRQEVRTKIWVKLAGG